MANTEDYITYAICFAVMRSLDRDRLCLTDTAVRRHETCAACRLPRAKTSHLLLQLRTDRCHWFGKVLGSGYDNYCSYRVESPLAASLLVQHALRCGATISLFGEPCYPPSSVQHFQCDANKALWEGSWPPDYVRRELVGRTFRHSPCARDTLGSHV